MNVNYTIAGEVESAYLDDRLELKEVVQQLHDLLLQRHCELAEAIDLIVRVSDGVLNSAANDQEVIELGELLLNSPDADLPIPDLTEQSDV